ncbi:restriction endonuclease subunit S [Streptococcus pseudopneumoniae]|uniref:restriction endonuclease subunit S n=2 Tax=Streptococcus TaxID=1301 RepID=UPI00110C3BB5|nr:restriction endonuclease subunit S [Streptococcus pseudopneumoniae]TMR56086.1 restriction endonuclease subunit S [Streptococcus pseudopneumoniae]
MKKVKLGQLVSIQTGKLDANAAVFGGKYPFFTTAKEISRINEYAYDGEVVLVAGNGDLNVKYYKGKFNAYQRTYILTSNSNVRMKYLYYFLDKYIEVLRYQSIGGVIKYIKLNNLSDAQIPMRSILEQDKIIGILEKLDNEIIIRSKQLSELSNLVKSRFNEMFGDVILNEKEWKVSKWNEILTIRNGKNQKQVEDADGKFPIYGSGGIMGYAKDWIVKKNSVIIGRKGNINKPILVRENFWNVDTAFGLEPVLEKINSEYLFYFCQLYNFEKLNKAVTIPSLTKSDLLNISIPLPPLALQNEFADFVVQVDKSQFACEIAIKVWRNSLKFSII